MLEVSRDAVAAGEEQLVSCAAKQSKYSFTCKVTTGHCGGLAFTSLGRWQCGDAGLKSCYEICGCGTECRCGALSEEDV
jgi:hypothetical protein